ncbi:MAG TPA: hypothetical protein VK524_03180, partial [Polyangiaceae bacterium]|nr:hypothetical protein [Polyangiaceae bacterium]
MPRTFRPSSCSAAALLIAGLLGARSSYASPLFELAGAQIGTGGFNARVTGPSAASTYFNPALLAHAKPSVDVGAMLLSDQISMQLDGRTGGIVPLRVGDRSSIFNADGEPISNATVPTDWLENGCTDCGDPLFGARPRQGDGSSGDTRGYVILGLVNRLIGERLVLGFHALLPLGNFT